MDATRRDRRRERGGILVVALVTMMVAVALAFAATSTTTARRGAETQQELDLQARAAAEGGVQRAIAWVRELAALDPARPFAGLDRLAGTPDAWGNLVPRLVADGEPLAMNGRGYAAVTVAVTSTAAGAARDVTIRACGVVPDARAPRAKASVRAVVRFAPRAAPQLDHALFLDSAASIGDDGLTVNGNLAANGPIDAAGAQPTIAGMPRFAGISLADPAHPDLLGALDDDNDKVTAGQDGGLYSAFRIVGAGNVRGLGGQAAGQHALVAPAPMPSLADLSECEARAIASGGSIAIGGGSDPSGSPLPPTPICGAVLGDDPGEPQNLVLIGTPDQPIVLNGPVVVRGDVILKGTVTGKGSIWAGRNVYVADDVHYANAPTTWQPSGKSESELEAWLAANAARDFLGLFAREQVVVGDFSDATWRSAVADRLDDADVAVDEDAGADGIAGTVAGRDLVAGTEDDDLLESDGLFSLELYTQSQADLGLVPFGKAVGDGIAGTGEDRDGDGVRDEATLLSDYDLSAPLDDATAWAGNLPAGVTQFAQIAAHAVANVDAVVATSHSFAFASDADFEMHGALVARAAAIASTTPSSPGRTFTYDPRLLGGGVDPQLLPQVLGRPRIVAWQWLQEDVRTTLAALGAAQ